jgi:hypothetical protein
MIEKVREIYQRDVPKHARKGRKIY